jgi:hypothetical protein
MATVRSDKQVVKVFITEAELATLLGAKALAAGVVSFQAEQVELIPSNEEVIETDPETGEKVAVGYQGWEVTFTRKSA